MKFKVGDVVIGKMCANERYSLTRYGWTGIVVAIDSTRDEDICVSKSTASDSQRFWVSSKYFDLCDSDLGTGAYRESRKIFISTRIKRVIYNKPATIVFWTDDTKTVVKCQKGEKFDKEKGLALCIAKKALGNKSNFNNEIKAWIEEK